MPQLVTLFLSVVERQWRRKNGRASRAGVRWAEWVPGLRLL